MPWLPYERGYGVAQGRKGVAGMDLNYVLIWMVLMSCVASLVI
jgi:hypothetical protein